MGAWCNWLTQRASTPLLRVRILVPLPFNDNNSPFRGIEYKYLSFQMFRETKRLLMNINFNKGDI
jgi:hypothetical protein